MINDPYCELVDTNNIFNNKKVYRCSYCGLQIGLDNSDTKMLCFKKMQENTMSIKKIHYPSLVDPILLGPNESMQEIVLDRMFEDAEKKSIEEKTQQKIHDDPNNMCSQEQIESRLAICNTCEYYKNNSCLLCGCQVVRESNYMNKLAHKNQKCPADKWGPLS